MNTVSPAKQFYPELSDRFTDPGAQPKHVICSYKCKGPERIIAIHTAGTDVVWSISAQAAASKARLIRGMDPEDAVSIGFFAGQISKHNGTFYPELDRKRSKQT